jgi:hypothetical protein
LLGLLDLLLLLFDLLQVLGHEDSGSTAQDDVELIALLT